MMQADIIMSIKNQTLKWTGTDISNKDKKMVFYDFWL